jgi:hypothetical protein
LEGSGIWLATAIDSDLIDKAESSIGQGYRLLQPGYDTAAERTRMEDENAMKAVSRGANSAQASVASTVESAVLGGNGGVRSYQERSGGCRYDLPGWLYDGFGLSPEEAGPVINKQTSS